MLLRLVDLLVASRKFLFTVRYCRFAALPRTGISDSCALRVGDSTDTAEPVHWHERSVLSALTTKAGDSIGALASDLFGMHTTGAPWWEFLPVEPCRTT
jgi:hypothetical protein